LHPDHARLFKSPWIFVRREKAGPHVLRQRFSFQRLSVAEECLDSTPLSFRLRFLKRLNVMQVEKPVEGSLRIQIKESDPAASPLKNQAKQKGQGRFTHSVCVCFIRFFVSS
jgi:hypothetical protein